MEKINYNNDQTIDMILQDLTPTEKERFLQTVQKIIKATKK